MQTNFQMNSSSLNMINLSNFHVNVTNPCGYCATSHPNFKNSKNWVTSGFTCSKMSPILYENLVEKGWRRCGLYYYKPEIDKCCCKPYSIRLDIDKFKLRSSQHKTMRKFENLLKNGDLSPLGEIDYEKQQQFNEKKRITEVTMLGRIEQLLENAQKYLIDCNNKEQEIDYYLEEEDRKKIKVFRQLNNKCEYQFYSNFLMIYHKFNKDAKQLNFKNFIKIITPHLENYFCSKLNNIHFKIYKSGYLTFSFNFHAYNFVHFNVFSQNTDKIDVPVETRHNFKIKIIKAKYEEESYLIYKRYCKEVHNQTESESNYKNFLCMQALEYEEKILNDENENEKSYKCGCYHMKYYIDNKLIAIGVVDLLPQSLSSVYFFYDPKFKKLSLGVVGVLKEIEFLKTQKKIFHDLKYYYLGYYIHNSKKMMYKADYEPSELLCPITHKWVEINKNLKDILEEGKTSKIDYFNQCPNEDMVINEDKLRKIILEKQKIFIDGKDKLVEELKFSHYYTDMLIKVSKKTGRSSFESFKYSIN